MFRLLDDLPCAVCQKPRRLESFLKRQAGLETTAPSCCKINGIKQVSTADEPGGHGGRFRKKCSMLKGTGSRRTETPARRPPAGTHWSHPARKFEFDDFAKG